MKRKGLSKKVRFEVFKRDSFKCQYCGASAPDVLLCIDHITPVAKGGKNDLMNLITACQTCNSGKAARVLSDSTAVTKQKKQLDEINERREQLKLMVAWKNELLEMTAQSTEAIAIYWGKTAVSYTLNEQGRAAIPGLLRKYSLAEIFDAIEASASYFHVENGKLTHDSVNLAWQKTPGICALRRAEKDKPYLNDVFRLRGLLRHRLSYVNEWEAKKLLIQALERATQEQTAAIRELCYNARNYSSWADEMEKLI